MSGHYSDILGPGYVRMMIRDLRTTIRIGVHPWEKSGPQAVIVNVEMFAKDPGRLQTQEVAAVVDYDRVRDAIGAWPARPHTELLESLLEELAQLCFEDPRVEACRVSVMKPDIFPEAAGAGVELFRVRK